MATRFTEKLLVLTGVGVLSLSLTGCAAHKVLPPAPPAPTMERVLLEDHFQYYSPYWRQVRGQWALTAGRLLQTRDDIRELNAVLFYDPLTIADAEITADAMMLAEAPVFQTADDQDFIVSKRRIAGAGIVFRYQDENNFYLFRTAGEDGVVLGKVVDGKWYELANPRAADFAGVRLQFDSPYLLRVRVVGSRIQAWIAGKAVANLEDRSLATGRVGLTTFRTKAAFTSVRVIER